MTDLFDNFPFVSATDTEFAQLFDINSTDQNFSLLVEKNGLKEFLYDISKNDIYHDINSAYISCTSFNEKFAKLKKDIDLSVFHINIHSLNSKIREFCTFINLLDIKFDVIVLSEIWSNNIEFYKNILPGYYLNVDICKSSNVGGVGVFIRKSLGFKLRNDLNLSSITHKIENLWYEIIKNNKKYIVGSIYRHPNQSIVDFTLLLEKSLKKSISNKIHA